MPVKNLSSTFFWSWMAPTPGAPSNELTITSYFVGSLSCTRKFCGMSPTRTLPARGLLLGLVEDVLDQRPHLLELDADGLLLLLRDRLLVARGLPGVLGAHEDRHLHPVVPVALEGVRLALGQQSEPEEVHGDHGHEHHRDGHGQVAAQPDPDLAEDELQSHEGASLVWFGGVPGGRR